MKKKLIRPARHHALAVAAFLCLGPAQAVITTTGDIGSNGLPVGPGNTDLGNAQLYVGNASPGSLLVDGGSQLLAGGISFAGSLTGAGTGTLTGAGTLVNLLGTGNRLDLGSWGNGSLTVAAGASLQARNSAAACGGCFNFIGNAAGSTGSLTVTGANSSASLWALVVGGAAVFSPPQSAFTFGTPGGHTRGSVQVLDGASLSSVASTLGAGPGGSNPVGNERSFASATVSGAGSLWQITSNLNNSIDPSLNLASHRNATATLEVSHGGQLLMDSVPGRFSNLPVGSFGRADAVISNGGRLQYGNGSGTSGLLQIGRNAGAQGSLQVLSGGVVEGVWYTSVGRDGGTGSLVVDGPGSLLRANGDSTVNTGGNTPSVASLDIGRNGGTGSASVSNGGRLEIVATLSRSGSPFLQVGRDATSSGRLNISGAGSTVLISAASTLPGGGAAEARNPGMRVGSLGTGVLTISGGGALEMQGNAVSTVDHSRSTSLYVGGVGDGASGGTGVATVTGAGSRITQTGSDTFIGVGMGAGANGTLNVQSQGAISSTIINLGRSGGVGVMNLDAGTVTLTGQQTGNNLAGAGMTVGSAGGTGVLNLSNGAVLSIDNSAGTVSAGMNLGGSGFFPGGQGIVTMSGGSRIDINAPANLGGMSIGRSGVGTLRMSASHISTHATGAILIGRDSGSVGTLLMSDASTVSTRYVGVGRTLDAAGVSSDGGIGALVVNSGSVVTAQTIEIGALGLLGGNGTLVGNVINHGSVNPGNSPGTLVIDGSFLNASGGRIVLEVESDGAGGFVTDHLIFSPTSTVDLAGTEVVFSFLGGTDPAAFQASGGFDIDQFVQQQTASGGTQALGDAAFSGVSFGAQSPSFTISGFSYTPAAGASFTATPVPEPATWASLAAGLLLLAGLRRRRS